MIKNDISKYITTFVITALLFGGAFYLSNYFNGKKIQNIKSTEDQIAVDILSSETQFDILKQSSCDQIDGSVLAGDLNTLGGRLSYMAGQMGVDNAEVVQLRKYYSVLQIKDYLLMNIYNTNCHKKPVVIMYFYSNDCTDCAQQDYVISYLHDTYPSIRIYSFDYNLDLSALKTLISLNKVPDKMPAIIINGKINSGYMTTEAIEKIIKPLLPVTASSTATSTKTGTATKK
jgi:hypothetical protein